MTNVLIRGHVKAQVQRQSERMPLRDKSDRAVNQEVSKIASSYQKLGENHKKFYPQSLKKEPTLLTS